MHRHRPPLWLCAAAAVYVLLFMLTFVAMFYGPDSPGWRLERRPNSYLVSAVAPGSPAAKAGILPGDVLLRWDGIPFVNPVGVFLSRTGPGQTPDLEVDRGGTTLTIPITFGYRPWRYHFTNAYTIAGLVSLVSALWSLLVGLFIVWQRPRDWRALGFAWALICGPMSTYQPSGLTYLWLCMPGPILVLLCAAEFFSFGVLPSCLISTLNFPRPLAVRRGYLALLYLPFLVQQAFYMYPHWLRLQDPGRPGPGLAFGRITNGLIAIYLAAILTAVFWNYRRVTELDGRRRLRIMMAGIAVGAASFMPGFAMAATPMAALFFLHTPAPVILSLLQIAPPICISYAILKHRVFDIQVIIRQGLQYAAARGLILSLAPLSGGALVIDLLLHADQPLGRILAERGWFYLLLALAAVILHRRQGAWLSSLDRRFFRERYNAQRILTAVVDEVRRASDFNRAAPGVVAQVDAALHPEFALLLRRRVGETAFTSINAGAEHSGTSFPAGGKLIALMRLLGKPVNCSNTKAGWLKDLPAQETDFLHRARVEWIYPISIEEGKDEAVLALGPRRSQEPYSGEDQELLAAICSALAVLLERSEPVAASTAPESAEVLAGRYRLERCLGRGGMGAVYDAYDTTLDRRVAVKLIRAELTADANASARFVREAKASAFGHPNVVTVHDFGVASDGRAFIVMELLEGRTLRQELDAERRLPLARAGAVLRDVCAAVEAAHARRLIHRDLKPENIFLARTPRGEIAKILDFGIAKPLLVGAETLTVNETAPGIVVGTPRYISPEQLRGQPASESSDLWALGVVVYEMLTGAYPFGTGDFRENLIAVRFTPAQQHVPDAPGSWNRFFENTLTADPARRPVSAAEFLAAFQKDVLARGSAVAQAETAAP